MDIKPISSGIHVSREDGKVDYIFVDAEKKLEMSLNNDSNVLEYFGIFSNLLTKNIKHIEYGNISAACIHVVKKSIFHEYKPNDLTVEAAWTFISNHFKGLSGKKMAAPRNLFVGVFPYKDDELF